MFATTSSSKSRIFRLKKYVLKRLQMRNQMAAASKTPIYDYPNNATLTRTTWFDQWTIAIKPDFDAKVNMAMKRANMRQNILDLIREAKEVRSRFKNLFL